MRAGGPARVEVTPHMEPRLLACECLDLDLDLVDSYGNPVELALTGYVIVRDPDTEVVKSAMASIIETIRIEYRE